VKRMCQLGRVSRAGFYRSLGTKPEEDPELELRDAMQRVALEFPSYGWPRMTRELRRRGWVVNHKRVYRLMREDNLLCLRRRKFVVTTNSAHDLPVYPNLARAITVTGRDQLWVTDITYIEIRGSVSPGISGCGGGARFHRAFPGTGVQPEAASLGLGLSSAGRIRGIAHAGPRHNPEAVAQRFARSGDGNMSFLRHGEIYRPISSCGSKPEQPWLDSPGAHRYDEFPAGYSLAGCAPAEPASASPAGVHRAAGRSGSTIEMQRTARSVLTACLTQGDNPTLTLFDQIERQGTGQQLYAQPDFDYLNKSVRPGVEVIRQTLEEWFSRYPVAQQPELRAQFRSDNHQHRSAHFELVLHELLLRLGVTVEVHPAIQGINQRPDFLATSPSGARWYLEAVLATNQSRKEAAAEARKNQVYDAINQLNSLDFFIGINPLGSPETPPSGQHIRAFLTKRLAGLNRDEIAALLQRPDVPGFEGLPHWRYEHDGWTIDFFPLPKSDALRGQAGVRPIGLEFGAFQPLRTKETIRNAVQQKAGRYGELALPYVVAVNVLSDFVDRTDEVEALFGGRTWPGEGRVANGVWRGTAGPQNTRVSGVAVFERLEQSNLPRVVSCLYHNPWAARPYQGELDRLNHAAVHQNRIQFHDGESLGTILGLPAGWPGE
jgi:hypothetical protein